MALPVQRHLGGLQVPLPVYKRPLGGGVEEAALVNQATGPSHSVLCTGNGLPWFGEECFFALLKMPGMDPGSSEYRADAVPGSCISCSCCIAVPIILWVGPTVIKPI